MAYSFSEVVAKTTNGSGKNGRESLSSLCSDLFSIVTTISPAIDMGSVQDCRKVINYHIALFEQNTKALIIDPSLISQAKYALVVLIDEKMNRLPKKWYDEWSGNKLQVEHFGETEGGVGFFRRLDELLINPSANGEVLEIYYLCLGMGFTGKFIEDPDGLMRKIRELEKPVLACCKKRNESIADYPEEPQVKKSVAKTVPRIASWLILLVTLGILIIGWFVAAAMVDSSSKKILPSFEYKDGT